MNQEIKDKALAKMLDEMNEKHSNAIDKIHNWLCDQDDNEVLMQNILKEGKTIKGALDYAKAKARKEAINGVAMIDDDTVYSWVVEYYASDKVETVPQTASANDDSDDDEGEENAKVSKPKKSKKVMVTAPLKQTTPSTIQTSIFDFAE